MRSLTHTSGNPSVPRTPPIHTSSFHSIHFMQVPQKRVNREQERKRREEGRGEGREVGGYYKHFIKRIEKIERIEGIQERVPLWVVNSNVHHELLLYTSHCLIHTHSHEETSSLKLHLIPNVLLKQYGNTLVSSIVSSCMKMFQVV